MNLRYVSGVKLFLKNQWIPIFIKQLNHYLKASIRKREAGSLNSAGLTNILIVVTRYFGGTLLGVSGLLNAYRTAAANAILNAEIIEQIVKEYYRINFPYAAMNDIMKILKEENLGQSQQMFDLECSMIVNFRLSSKEKVLNRLARVEGINCTYIETR